MAGCCEYGDEPSGFIKTWKFLCSFRALSSSRRALHHGLS